MTKPVPGRKARQILDLARAGMTPAEIATALQSRPGYVARVLGERGRVPLEVRVENIERMVREMLVLQRAFIHIPKKALAARLAAIAEERAEIPDDPEPELEEDHPDPAELEQRRAEAQSKREERREAEFFDRWKQRVTGATPGPSKQR